MNKLVAVTVLLQKLTERNVEIMCGVRFCHGGGLFIETQNVAPPDSRIELINDAQCDWNVLQSALLKLRLG